MTNDLLGQVDGDETEALDFLPEEKPTVPTRPASTTRKNPPTPIRLTPPGSERRVAPDRPARLSQPADATTPRVSTNSEQPAASNESNVRVRSALETLFAPYGAAPTKPVPSQPSASSTADTRSSIPGSSAGPTKPILDLKDLEIDLGPARQVIPATSIPQQAASIGLFSPRKVSEAAKVAASPPESVSPPAVSTAKTHQPSLK
jgi:hypothetical protein